MIARTRLVAAAAALSLAAGSAFAQTQHGTAENGLLSIPDVVQSLQDKGYTDIESVDRDRDRYEVDARDANGRFVEVTIDAGSGEILHTEREDD